MKKSVFFSILILFVLSTTAFAGLSDPKTESAKPALINPIENKLSAEELSLLTRRTETDNLRKTNLVNKESSNNNDLKAPQVVVVDGNQRHGGYIWYGGATLLLIVLLVVILL